jgi:hypothetical protein
MLGRPASTECYLGRVVVSIALSFKRCENVPALYFVAVDVLQFDVGGLLCHSSDDTAKAEDRYVTG